MGQTSWLRKIPPTASPAATNFFKVGSHRSGYTASPATTNLDHTVAASAHNIRNLRPAPSRYRPM